MLLKIGNHLLKLIMDRGPDRRTVRIVQVTYWPTAGSAEKPRNFVKKFRRTYGRWMQCAEVSAVQEPKRHGSPLRRSCSLRASWVT